MGSLITEQNSKPADIEERVAVGIPSTLLYTNPRLLAEPQKQEFTKHC